MDEIESNKKHSKYCECSACKKQSDNFILLKSGAYICAGCVAMGFDIANQKINELIKKIKELRGQG